ncbi:MAG TPA: beta-ketoacyl synthase N-terminal-like domain-containing protein [Ktedonobacteraceae bacterium]|nr:beta-ketoacyl synthase N-terminal-like domain-containing protein [Ktedonobacteraceae bacterium]
MANNSNEETAEQDVAIIGMAGRFPGARSIDQFWHNLQDGKESITFFSEEEALAAGADPNLVKHPHYVKVYGVLDDIELFAAEFFGFSPREAQTLDPQQRFFLECAWEALENAGYDAETYKGHIGVFAGASMSGYLRRILANREIANAVGGNQIMLGNDKDYISTRVSYKMNLKGPAITVQSACSTSLVAVHLACQSLINGESDMCMVGGVSIAVPQKAGYLYQEGSIQSPDGHCRAFDARGQGIVSGSGVAIVVLKRLSDALADRDTIHAVIKGSALNNDGALKIGFTAPSIEGQAEVIAEALAVAGIEPESITYIEAHGTGTPLGDPIEIAALTRAFSARTQKKGFCAIGSVKTNIGHLDAAAGVAGLIKVVLALKYRQIPASLHFTEPNPKIDFAHSPFYVNTRLLEWSSGTLPRRAGVSSFGIGGTNAHVVLEEAPQPDPLAPAMPWQLLVFSAKSGSALESMTSNLTSYLKEHPDLPLADVAYTCQVGRHIFNYRRFVVGRDCEDVVNALTAQPERVYSAFQESKERPVIFMFPGGGAQHVRMGFEMYQQEPAFRAEIDRCSHLLKARLGCDLRTILYPSSVQDEDQAAQLLRRTSFALPALFTTEYALAKLWMSWGIQPQATIGHSLGEYVAACLSGVFSLQDALALVALRGRLFEQLPEGAMLSVRLPAQEIAHLLTPDISLAAVNAPSFSVISGSQDAITRMEASLKRRGIEVRRVQIDVAAHSAMVVPILEPFRQLVAQFSLQPPRLPYISNVSGTWITAQEATSPDYWVTHLRETVRFADGIQTLLREPYPLFLEVGPGRTLSMLIKQQPGDNARLARAFPSLRSTAEQPSERASLLITLGQLWQAGVHVDWQAFSARQQRRHIPLPTYPFERQRYWVDLQPDAPELRRRESVRLASDEPWLYIPSWKRSHSPELPVGKAGLEQATGWLVFTNRSEPGAQIAQRLREIGQPVITVSVGDQFRANSDDSYLLNPRRPADYTALITVLHESGRLPDSLLYFWSNNDAGETGNDVERANRYLGSLHHLQNLLSVVQARSNSGAGLAGQPFEIIIITNNGQEVTGQEMLDPEQALLAGLCQIIAHEYPRVTCRVIDSALPMLETRQKVGLLNALAAECLAQSSDQLIAYRGKHRWIKTFEQLPLRSSATTLACLRKGGSYIIIDGPGAPGPFFADYLQRTHEASVLLVEPISLPTRDAWEQWLATHPPFNERSRTIQQLQAIEASVARIQVRWANLAQREDMRTLLDAFAAQTGALHGVISLAGFTAETVEQRLDETSQIGNAAELQTKLDELVALEDALRKHTPDFCIVGSSPASIFGKSSHFLDTAIGHLVDAFIQQHNQDTSSPWLSVHWDSWQSSNTHETLSAGEGLTVTALTRAFEQLTSTTTSTNILVLSEDLDSRAGNWSKLRSEQAEEGTLQTGLETSHLRPDLQTTYVAPTSEIEKTVAVLWKEMLGIEPIGIHDNFFELGGHSLMAAQLTARLREVFLVEIPLQSIFERPTIAGLAEVAEALFVEKLEQLSDEEAERLLSQVFQ